MLKAPETLKDAIAESLWQVRERAEQRGDSHIQLPSDEKDEIKDYRRANNLYNI